MWRIWLAALFWGLNWPAVKIVLEGMSPWTLRTVGLGGGAVLLLLATVLMREPLSVPRQYWRPLLISSLLSVAGFNIFAVFAQLNLPTSRAAILTFTMPLWAALFAWIWGGEQIDRLRAQSLALGAGGLFLLSLPFWPVLQAGGLPIGLVYVLGAAITWAAGTVYMKRNPIPLPPIVVATWQIGLATLACLAGTIAFETPRVDLSSARVQFWLAFHMMLPQAVSYVLWFSLIRSVSASTISLGTLLIPIFGVAGAMAILGEQPAATDFAGFALILAGIVLDQAVRAWRMRG